MSKSSTKNHGFTLVELMIVVAIIGLLAAVAIPAFSRYVKKSRTAEAIGHINKMWAGSVTYLETDHANSLGAVVPKQFPDSTGANAEAAGSCCSSTGGKCPADSSVYKTPTWMALSFALADPHHFAPGYVSTGTDGGSVFSAIAQGDLDCDGQFSLFQRTGKIDSSGSVAPAAGIYTENELE